MKQIIEKVSNNSYFRKNTKCIWKVIGDSILIFGMGLQSLVVGLPIADNTAKWMMFGIGIFTLAGKIICNAVKESDKESESEKLETT